MESESYATQEMKRKKQKKPALVKKYKRAANQSDESRPVEQPAAESIEYDAELEAVRESLTR